MMTAPTTAMTRPSIARARSGSCSTTTASATENSGARLPSVEVMTGPSARLEAKVRNVSARREEQADGGKIGRPATPPARRRAQWRGQQEQQCKGRHADRRARQRLDRAQPQLGGDARRRPGGWPRQRQTGWLRSCGPSSVGLGDDGPVVTCDRRHANPAWHHEAARASHGRCSCRGQRTARERGPGGVCGCRRARRRASAFISATSQSTNCVTLRRGRSLRRCMTK